MRRLALFLLLAAVAGSLATPAHGVAVTLERPPVTTSIGKKFTFATTVENTAARPASDLVAHLNVLSDDPGTYVDPEDWSSQRTRYLPAIPPNRKLRLDWTVQAVNGGNLTVFVSVLPRHGPGTVATSPPLRVSVEQRRTLDSGGVLPLVLGIPAAIGLLGFATRRRRPR